MIRSRIKSRRTLLFGCLSLLLTAAMVACSSGTPAQSTGPETGASASPSESPNTSEPRTSKGELRIAESTFPTSLDGDKGFAGFSLMGYGIAEALTRVTPEMKIVPWVAEKVEQIDSQTWNVTIRDDVTFWDGSKVDAAAVKASLERSLAEQPGTATLLPNGTTMTANGQVLEFNTPVPVGAFESHLASFNFSIKKITPDGKIIYTGPYMYEDFVERTSVTLRAYPDYRGGPPRSEAIYVRYIPDINARLLALQAGDVDMAYALLPSHIAQLQEAGFKVHNFTYGRQDDIILNVTRAPLDDVNVRRAISLAIDREVLVEGVMEGMATPAYGFAPENIGLDGILKTQTFDRAEAERLLDQAGWTKETDGMRAKDGVPLAFTLGFYSDSRPELEPLATAIKDQLKAVGMDVGLEQFAKINTTVAENAFDATMYSYTVAPFGDLDRALGTLYTPSATNKDRYNNPRVNALFDQYNQKVDPSARAQVLQEIQNVIGEDVPVVYVVNPNQIVATSSKVKGYTPHPLENYKIDTELRSE